MTERFSYPDLVNFPAHAGRVSIAHDATSATFSNVALSGTDWAGSTLMILPDDDLPYLAGVIAEGTPKGVYPNAGPLPLVWPYQGTEITDAKFCLVKGLGLADAADLAAIVAKFRTNFANNAGLVYDYADDPDESLMTGVAAIFDHDGRRLLFRRDGVTEQFPLNPDRNPMGPWRGGLDRHALSVVSNEVDVDLDDGPNFILEFDDDFELQPFTNCEEGDFGEILFVADGAGHTPSFDAVFSGIDAENIRTAADAETRVRFTVTSETGGTATAISLELVPFAKNDYVEHKDFNYLSNIDGNTTEPSKTDGDPGATAWTWVPSEAGAPGSALLTATSTSSIVLEAGSKVFTLAEEAERGFGVGSFVIAADSASPTTKYGLGQVTAYDHPTLTVSFVADNIVGSGTISSWTISAASLRGMAAPDPGFLYEWDTGTSDADPGAGKIRANNADLSSATVLYASKTTRGGSDVGALLNALDASTNTAKGTALLTKAANEKQAGFVYGTITDASGYVKIAISGHSGETAFTAGDAISFQATRDGNAGNDGLGTGDVVGPGSSTDRAIATFNGTDGKLLRNNTPTIGSNGQINIPAQNGYEITYSADSSQASPFGNIYRQSASPAADDQLGAYCFYGQDSNGNKTEYARIVGRIDTPTDSAEDGGLSLSLMVAGTFTANVFRFFATGAMRLTSIELGHATDTTLSRIAAGTMGVEGVVNPSFTNTAWAAASFSSPNITCAVNNGVQLTFTRTMAGNETLAIPTNMPDGSTIYLAIAVGSNTLSFASGYEGAGDELPACEGDCLLTIVRHGSRYYVTALIDLGDGA